MPTQAPKIALRQPNPQATTRQEVCQNKKFDLVPPTHAITAQEFTQAMLAFFDANKPTKNYTWQSIQALINNANCVTDNFTFDGGLDYDDKTNNNDINIIVDSSTANTVYSIPLLKGVGQLHNLTDTDSLQFTKATINYNNQGDENCVIFSVKKGGDAIAFYNMSTLNP
jgi:hypothetical protein